MWNVIILCYKEMCRVYDGPVGKVRLHADGKHTFENRQDCRTDLLMWPSIQKLVDGARGKCRLLKAFS